MPTIVTCLEAPVPPERREDLQAAYRAAAEDDLPPGLVRSALLQSATDPNVWRIETVWDSRAALEAMRGQGTPRGVLIFRAAGAEPALSLYGTVDTIARD